MNVLSLFDGMSCGQIALDRLGIPVNNYFASEIDKYATKVTKKNYPNTEHLGDILDWENWNIDWSSIDLVTGGFPCQSWSVAGKQLGDKDERGMLFWTMLDIMSLVLKSNPKAKFLMENVRMKKEFESYITTHTEKALGKVNKHLIDSSLVSGQNRKRFYWTNITNITQPEDKGITLKDIILDGKVDRHKSYCLDANYFKGTNLAQYLKKCRRQVVFNYSSSGRGNGRVEHRFYDSENKKAHCLTKVCYTKRSFSGVYNEDGIRKLTPLECERLQTVPEGYTEGVSNTQRYKMLGNGWTVDVICHILKNMEF